MKNISKQDILMYICLALFCIITIAKLINHIPWYDECTAWIIAKEMTFDNIVKTLSGQGHFIIWYGLLMPFAKSNFCFPYSMFIINWVCYFAAMFVLWKKAPFHPVAKIIITFSWLSLNYFPIVARCHSVEILGLFLVASLYKDQIKKPVLYSSLLVLTAHTHLFAAIAVTPLAIIFIYNIVKNKNDFSIRCLTAISCIFIVGAFLWLYPLIFGSLGYDGFLLKKHIDMYSINRFFANDYHILFYYLITTLIVYILTNNKIRFFIIFTNSIFFFFHTALYEAYYHNMVFIFVYLILAYWLTDKIHTKQILNTFFMIFFACLLLYNYTPYLQYTLNNIYKSDLIEYLNKKDDIKNIYMQVKTSEIQPYLNSKFKIETFVNEDNYQEVINNIPDEQRKDTLIITEKKVNDLSIPFEYPQIETTWYVTRL